MTVNTSRRLPKLIKRVCGVSLVVLLLIFVIWNESSKARVYPTALYGTKELLKTEEANGLKEDGYSSPFLPLQVLRKYKQQHSQEAHMREHQYIIRMSYLGNQQLSCQRINDIDSQFAPSMKSPRRTFGGSKTTGRPSLADSRSQSQPLDSWNASSIGPSKFVQHEFQDHIRCPETKPHKKPNQSSMMK